MRKTLLLLSFLFLASCGGGGGGASGNKGFYTFSLAPEETSIDSCAVQYDVNADTDTVKSYSIPLDVVKVTATSYYDGTGTPLRMFLKNAVLESGGYREVVFLSGLVTSNGIEFQIPISAAMKTHSSIIYANDLEDRTFTTVSHIPIASYSSIWQDEEKSFTYVSPVTLDVGEGVRDVLVEIDNVTCVDDGNGSLTSPCVGRIDYENGTVEVGIDESYLREDHEKTFSSNGTATVYLSSGIIPNSVVLENTDAGITVYDDGNGNLLGDGSGTVDYDRGIVTLTLNDSKLQKEENSETLTVPFSSSGSQKLQAEVVPNSITMTAYDSSGTVIGTCSDNGAGTLFGNCTGTVDYKSGALNYSWNVSGGDSVDISYSFRKAVAVSLLARWQTQDRNLSAVVSYRKLSDSATKTFTFVIPGNPSQVLIKEGNAPVENYTLTHAGTVYTLTLQNYPDSDLTAEVVYERTFNFNPYVFVSDPHPVSVPIHVTVNAELETGDEISNSFDIVVNAQSCSSEQFGAQP